MIRLTHVVRGVRQCLPIVAWFATLILTGHTMAGQSLAGRDVTFYVTDRGVNQKEGWEQRGSQGLHWTMSDLDQNARIPVVMPGDNAFKSLSTEALRQRTFLDLKTQVDRGMSAGLNQFEVQLVQDINFAGYVSFGPDDRQGMVDRFGAAAYGAIADLNTYLHDNGVRTTNHAIVGSNGAKVFAANVKAWQGNGPSIWDSVDFFDGRAYLTPMVEAIQSIGSSRVRIFNTSGDIWAPFADWGLRSIANRDTARYIKDSYFPELQVYELLVRKKDAALNHISGMTDGNIFWVFEYVSHSAGLQRVPNDITGRDLRHSLPPSVPRALPKDVKNGIAIWRPVIEEFSDLLSTGPNKLPHRLAKALTKDIEQSSERDVVILTSHTFEEVVKYSIEQLAEGSLKKHASGQYYLRRLDAYKEFFSGAMEMRRTGKVDADTLKSFDQGVIELVKQEWREHSPELKAARWKVRESERQVHAAEQVLRNTQQQLHRWPENSKALYRQEAQVQRLAAQLEHRKTALTMAQRAERSLTNRLLLLDSLPVFAMGIAEYAQEGHLTVDVVDHFSDGVIMLSATVIATGLEGVPVLAPFVPQIRDGIVAVATSTRNHLSQETVRKIEEKFSVLEEYLTYQARAVHDRQVIKTWSEIYSYDSLRRLGYTHQQITEQDKQAMQLNIARGLEATSSKSDSTDIKGPQSSDIPSVHWQCEGGGQFCPPPSTNQPPVPPCIPGIPPCGGSDSLAANHRPPHSGGSGAGGGNAPPKPGPPGVSSSSERSQVIEHKNPLGGIDLDVQSVVVDSNSGTIAVLTENGSESDANIATRDLAFALWLTYSGQQAAFSLDPADPKDPSGKWLRAVYFPDILRSTMAGRDLFDADFLLKQYAFNVQVKGNQIVERHTATALKSIPQLMKESAGARTRENAAQWARLWIVVPRLDLQVTNGIARITDVRMAVRARRQVPDPSSRTGLRDVDTEDDSVESRFARQFSELYTKLGHVEAPPLLRVRELAKAIAYAQWMKQQHIPVDMKQVLDVLNQDRVEAIDRITALSVDWQNQTQELVPVKGGTGVRTSTRTIHIFGGVDLTVTPKMTKSSAPNTLHQTVMSKLSLARSNTHFVVEHDGRRYQAFVMPFRMVNR